MSQQHLQPNNENQLVALGRVLQILREEENAEVLLETTLDYLKTEFNYRLIWIGLYDRLEHRLCGKGGTTPTGDITFLHQWFNLNPGDVLEQVVIQQRPVGIPDLRQEVRAGEWRRAAQDLEIQGTLLFPLRCKDRCFGVVLLGSHLWGVSPRPGEKALLSALLGGLAAALYQIEVEWQRSSTKRPDQPLFQVLDELMQVPTLAQRLETVVRMTQEFVTPTRTNLYWYSQERRYFWHRVGNQQMVRRFGDLRSGAAGLTVAEVSDFYQALVAGQLVAIGAGRSLLKPESTENLLKRLRTRSLLAAPIQVQGELLGFVSVEDNAPRIWEDAERNYVRAMAQLVALVVGTEEMEASLQLVSQDAHFAAEIARAIVRGIDTTAALRNCAELLCKRLDAERFLILQEDDKDLFSVVFQQQPPNRRILTTSLNPLWHEDRQQLGESAEAVMIEDLDEDVRLLSWRDSLKQLGVRSLLLVSIGESLPSNPTSTTSHSQRLSLLVIAHGTPRTWNQSSRDVASIVAQQISLILKLDWLQDSAKASVIAHQTLQSGLSLLSQPPIDSSEFDLAWLEYLANRLECPLAAILSWTLESPYATVAAEFASDPRLALPQDLAIPVTSNALIQEALATNGFLSRPVAAFGATARKWLNHPGLGQVLVIALHTEAIPTTAIIVLADHEERHWSQHLLPPLETLTHQFAWFRYYRHYLNHYQHESENLQTLNWYKHRCLETFYQSVRESLKALLELDANTSLPTSTNGADQLDSTDSAQISGTLAPTGQNRRQRLLHQLEQTLAVLNPLLRDEQWQLAVNLHPVPLAGLLKRSLRHVQPLYTQRQLMVKVYNKGKFSVYGDLLKLECILFELLTACCFQAQPGSWINLWCSPISSESRARHSDSSAPLLELLLAESGFFDPSTNPLASLPIQLPNSLNLQICQDVVRPWGGDLQFYQLEGDRYLSRLLLPLVK